MKKVIPPSGRRITDEEVDGLRQAQQLSFPMVAILCLSLLTEFSEAVGMPGSNFEQSEPEKVVRYESPHLRVMLNDPAMRRFIEKLDLRPQSFALSIPVDESGKLRRDHAVGQLLLRNTDCSIALGFQVRLIVGEAGAVTPFAYSSMLYMSKDTVLAPGWSPEIDQFWFVKGIRVDPTTAGHGYGVRTFRGGQVVEYWAELSPPQEAAAFFFDRDPNRWTGLGIHNYTMPQQVTQAMLRMRRDIGPGNPLRRADGTHATVVADPDSVAEMLVNAMDESRPLSEMADLIDALGIRPIKSRVEVDFESWKEGVEPPIRAYVILAPPCGRIELSFWIPSKLKTNGVDETVGHLHGVDIEHPELACAVIRSLKRFAPLSALGEDYTRGEIVNIIAESGADSWEFTLSHTGEETDVSDGRISHAIGQIVKDDDAEQAPWLMVTLRCREDFLSVAINLPSARRWRHFGMDPNRY